MKRFSLLTFIFLATGLVLNAQERPTCGFTEAMKQHFTDHPEELKKYRANRALIDQLAESRVENVAPVVYQIPVVVHVVYNSEAVDISEAQIRSQIEVLNEDFRKLNTDVSNVPNAFSSLAADIEIEFCLARFDPNGQWTNGITRTQTSTTFFGQNGAIMSSSTGGTDPWDVDQYLNIWVGRLFDQLLGFAYPVGTTNEGVVIDYRKFGRGAEFDLQSPYNLGRTATHEIGHYFDLLHLWGDNNDCNLDDGIADTPDQLQPNFGCPSHPSISCSNSGDMFMNFMDYVDDACMVMFSEGQKARVRAAIEGPGSTLIQSIAPCDFTSVNELPLSEELLLIPNPTTGLVSIQNDKEINISQVSVFNSLGAELKTTRTSDRFDFLDLSEHGPGIYFLRFETDGGLALKKLVIQ